MREPYPPIQLLSPERARALVADPARRDLLDQIMAATTREQIDAAWQAHRAWLVANPDDIGVLEAGEDLVYAEEALDAGPMENPHDREPQNGSAVISSSKPASESRLGTG
jgi:hypothetical protein